MDAIDVFSGCGGFSSGAMMAGLNVVSAIDFYKPSIDTYRYNIGNHVVNGDIRDPHNFDDLVKPRASIVFGSPPCQGFSMAGLRDIIDERNLLVTDYLRVVKHVNPRAFLIENVSGILSARMLKKNASDDVKNYYKLLHRVKYEESINRHARVKDARCNMLLKNMIDTFKKNHHVDDAKIIKNTMLVIDYIIITARSLGYNVIFDKINAADYGVPQYRVRAFFIGVKNKEPTFPRPDHFSSSSRVVFGDKIKKHVNVRDAIDYLKDFKEDADFSHVYSKHSSEFYEKIKKLNINESIYTGYNQSYRKIDPDKPAPTVTDNHGGIFVHYSRDRLLTCREIGKLQTFEDSFKFIATKSQTTKMIGNAVPCLLAAKLLKHVASIVE